MAVAKKETKPAAKKTAAPAAKTAAKPAPKKEVAPKERPKVYHISQYKNGAGFQVKAEGSDKVLKTFKTQKEAIDYAKKVAGNQDGRVVCHSLDGSIRKV